MPKFASLAFQAHSWPVIGFYTTGVSDLQWPRYYIIWKIYTYIKQRTGEDGISYEEPRVCPKTFGWWCWCVGQRPEETSSLEVADGRQGKECGVPRGWKVERWERQWFIRTGHSSNKKWSGVDSFTALKCHIETGTCRLTTYKPIIQSSVTWRYKAS